MRNYVNHKISIPNFKNLNETHFTYVVDSIVIQKVNETHRCCCFVNLNTNIYGIQKSIHTHTKFYV